MSSTTISPPLRYLFAAAAAVIVTYGIREAAGPVSTVLLAGLLAQTLQPLQDWLRARGLSATLSVVVTIILVLVAGFVISSLLATSVGQLRGNVPVYRTSLQALESTVTGWIQARGIPIPDFSHLDILSPGAVAGLVGGLASGVLSGLGNTVVILLLMVFMLIEPNSEASGKAGMFAFVRKHAGQTQQYIRITSITGLIFSVLVTVVMLAVGTDGAVTWGVLGFFLSFVPNLGIFLTVIPPVLLTLLELGLGPAILVLAAFIVINFLTDNILKPRFMRSGLNLGLLESFLALMFFGWVLGATGAILSIPLYLILKEVLRGHSARPAVATPP